MGTKAASKLLPDISSFFVSSDLTAVVGMNVLAIMLIAMHITTAGVAGIFAGSVLVGLSFFHVRRDVMTAHESQLTVLQS